MKKSYLKPKVVYNFIYNVFFFYNGYDGNGRKKPEKFIYTKN